LQPRRCNVVHLHTDRPAAGPGHGEGRGVAVAPGSLVAVFDAVGGVERVVVGDVRVAEARARAAEAAEPGVQRGRRAARVHPPLRLPRQEDPQDGAVPAGAAALGTLGGVRPVLRPPPSAPRPRRLRIPSPGRAGGAVAAPAEPVGRQELLVPGSGKQRVPGLPRPGAVAGDS
jgi:hypothetical protein